MLLSPPAHFGGSVAGIFTISEAGMARTWCWGRGGAFFSEIRKEFAEQ